MRRPVLSRRALRLLALFVVVGLLGYGVLERVQATPPPKVSVLVATRDIQIAEQITPAMVQAVSVPQNGLLGPDPVYAAEQATVVGQRARLPILAGAVILKGEIYGPGLTTAGNADDVLLPRGYNLTWVPTGHGQMPGSGLLAGDWVTIYTAVQQRPISGTTSAPSPEHCDTLATCALQVQPLVPHVLVTYVDRDGLTLALPQRVTAEVQLLARAGQLFYAQVRPDDTRESMQGATAAGTLALLRKEGTGGR
jgi:hypothetical protein